MSARRALLVPATLALGAALTLTACQSGGDGGEAQPGKLSQSAAATTAGGGGKAGGSEAYAYSHPCEAKKLAVKMTARAEAPDQRVIEVRNQGTTACGLSYYPLVSLGNSHAADHSKDLTPLVPGELGGPPAYPVAPGQKAYAVVDLNPGGGSAADVNELNILPDDRMPNSDTQNFPLGPGAKVGKPKLGLYRGNVADAAASTATVGRS
ncbi:DUF4232 domain-containing protein [Microtetraspora malaysiensis]|uniref:DUF4232 domain-containing protein n=1 Tax=Microtetraspora malaysiensis TaxID=161358 RepID=UPI003D9096FE